MRRLTVLVAAAACALTVGCTSDGAGGGRTHYESLDLGTPEAAAETFVEAFQASDFMTVWLALHPEAQFAVQQYRDLLLYDHLIDPTGLDLQRELRAVLDFELMETADSWWFFDQIMMIAAGHDALLVDLRGDVALRDAVQGPDGATDVPAVVEGIEGTVIIRIEERAGRFRVLQIIVPGGSAELLPWSLRALEA